VLKDFIWLFTGSPLLKEKLQEKENNNQTQILNQFLKQKNLKSYLKELLDEAHLKENLAQNSTFYPIRRMNLWNDVKKIYDKARDKTEDKEINAFVNLGYLRACINLSKYTKAFNFIKSHKANPELIKNHEFWLLGAISHRKQFKYDKANQFIQQASNLKPNNEKLSNEFDLIQKLKETKPLDYAKSLSKSKGTLEYIPFSCRYFAYFY
jgi:hypothetical protein